MASKQEELLRFRQLARMADDAFRRAHLAEYEANVAKNAVRKLQTEIRDRIECLEIELDIPAKEPESSSENDDGDCERKAQQEDRRFGARNCA